MNMIKDEITLTTSGEVDRGAVSTLAVAKKG